MYFAVIKGGRISIHQSASQAGLRRYNANNKEKAFTSMVITYTQKETLKFVTSLKCGRIL